MCTSVGTTVSLNSQLKLSFTTAMKRREYTLCYPRLHRYTVRVFAIQKIS